MAGDRGAGIYTRAATSIVRNFCAPTRQNVMAAGMTYKQEPGIAAGPFAFRIAPPYDSACFTAAGENGTRLIRTPVASKIALAIAAIVGFSIVSPAP